MQKLAQRLFGNFRARYIPLLMVYFAYGASGFSSIAESFWVKEELKLSVVALAVIGFWVGIPWTIKMIFGQCVDSIRIFGSGRRIYIFFGASLLIAGQLILIGLASKMPWLLQFGSPEKLFFLAAILSVLGFVIQDVVADAMSTEVVERKNPDGTPRDENAINAELTQVQWLGRVALMTAGMAVAGLGGWLAQVLSYPQMFTIALFVPILSVTGAICVRLNPIPRSPINWKILGGGLLFGALVVALNLSDIAGAEEIVFVVSLCVIAGLIWQVGIQWSLALAAIAIFMFRATPGTGAGVGWWMIDVLGFDKAFQGTLSQIGSLLALAGLFLFRKYITERPVAFTLTWLTIAGAILSLPTIGLFYGVHDWLGVSARTVALVDTTISAPLGMLSMIPLLALIARTCPEGKAGTWFALMASLMNLALSASALGTKYLNQMFPVERGDYHNVGLLLIISWSIGLVVPLVAIYFFLRKFKMPSAIQMTA
ncbi:MAG: hypothetical protein HYT22_03290 [Candidatus Niyogibacteria bacterium]|nr:hypothetical protein [Candidatus Niyogibacteria bacterium]